MKILILIISVLFCNSFFISTKNYEGYENMIREVMLIKMKRDGTNPFHNGGKVPNHLSKPLL